MDNDSWFPCYPTNLISSSSRLCPHDFGAYWRLLCDYYQHGPLPDDDDALRNISGVEKADWARTKGKLMVHPFFYMNGDGKWHQKKADKVIQDRNELMSKKRAQTAAARAANPKNAVTESVTDSVTEDVTVVQPQPQPHPQQQPGGRSGASGIRNEKELERIEKRIEEIRQQGTLVAGSPMRYSTKQKSEMIALKDRREELKKLLGFVA